MVHATMARDRGNPVACVLAMGGLMRGRGGQLPRMTGLRGKRHQ
jgi:hypothetical protein